MINLRRANNEDIQPICSFDQIAINNEENRRNFIAKSIESGVCFVAEINGKVIGYGVFDYTFYSNGMIDMLYTYPEHGRQGIGTKLVKHVELICETGTLFSSTNQSNLLMQGLLNKLGYVASGFIDDLDEDDPEIVYFKRAKKNR